jgi:hypothetical protein
VVPNELSEKCTVLEIVVDLARRSGNSEGYSKLLELDRQRPLRR